MSRAQGSRDAHRQTALTPACQARGWLGQQLFLPTQFPLSFHGTEPALAQAPAGVHKWVLRLGSPVQVLMGELRLSLHVSLTKVHTQTWTPGQAGWGPGNPGLAAPRPTVPGLTGYCQAASAQAVGNPEVFPCQPRNDPKDQDWQAEDRHPS